MPYSDFDAFCRDAQPWGLGMAPLKFRAYLEAELGKRAAELVTVDPIKEPVPSPGRGNTKPSDTVSEGLSATHSGAEQRKSERLRAILRAPESIQTLYREGLVSQTVAASMGPAGWRYTLLRHDCHHEDFMMIDLSKDSHPWRPVGEAFRLYSGLNEGQRPSPQPAGEPAPRPAAHPESTIPAELLDGMQRLSDAATSVAQVGGFIRASSAATSVTGCEHRESGKEEFTATLHFRTAEDTRRFCALVSTLLTPNADRSWVDDLLKQIPE